MNIARCAQSISGLLLFSLSSFAFAIPVNSYEVDGGWECKDGFRKQGQQCNPLYVPPNARLEGKAWACLPGYKRQSNQCNPVSNQASKSTVASALTQVEKPEGNEAVAVVKQAEALYIKGNYDQAFEVFLPLAMQGNASAQFYLAELYQADKDGLDKKQATYWYHKSASQGNPNAQYNLGNAYYDGEGVPTDLLKAANWYELAAKNGVPEAQLNLGYMYSKGNGVGQDDRLATMWYMVAARRGSSKAQSNLGFRYCQGRGIERDLERCAFWVKKALAQGHPNAKKIWDAFKLEKHVSNPEKNIG